MGRRRGEQPPGESRAERIIAVPTSKNGKQREAASLGRPAPWVPRDLPSWADATERPHRHSGSPGVGMWAVCASGSSGQPWPSLRALPLCSSRMSGGAGSPLSEQPSLSKSEARERPLGFRRQKQKPWDGQGQTEADNEATPFPARNFFPKLQHCWLPASLSSCLTCDPGSTLSSGTEQSPKGTFQLPPHRLLSIL